MGEVSVGDQLLDASGRPTTVVAATEVMTGRPCFEVEFSDGAVVVADAQHQWLTDTRASRRCPEAGPEIRTTEELAATVRCAAAGHRLNHSVRTCFPLDLPARELPVPPYSLGVWLGGVGSSDADPNPAPLRALGVLGDEHIPAGYQRACEGQRRALLAGLLDTDGTVTGSGDVQLCVTSARLARDVRELVVGLGYRCGMGTEQARGRTGESRTGYTITFGADDDVFRLERKRLAHKERRRSPARSARRYVTDVRPVPSVPVRCVQVDNAERLYLAGRSMIPTHNSTLGLDWARSCSVKHGMSSVVFSLEMSRTEIVMRLLSAEARIRLSDMRSGRMSDDDWTRLARRMGEISEAPLFIDDSPNMTMMEIRAKARRLKQRNDLKLIVLDYLQLMTSGKRVESRQQEVSEFSRQLKLLAKELEVPLVAISQLNRGPEQRTDKKPMLADLRESGCLTAGTRVLRADTGGEVTLGALLNSGERNVPVWSLDERLRLVPQQMTHAFSSGIKEAFRLTLTSGRTVEATANHPFLTLNGWRRLDELSPGSRLAVLGHRAFSTALGTKFCGTTGSMLEPASSSSAWKHGVGRARMARVAEILDDAELELLASNDVRWDEIESIDSIGEQPVYDATVLGTHNFIANGIAVHNSIEQDADMVVLLHRPDAFERDDPRAGEADLILAKHRNGPTSTITVAHQLHYSRFVDMAQG
jgi:replicative DNA helicase